MTKPADPAAIELIKKFEGCRLEAYRDQGGVWTVGWGTTGAGIGPGTRWTQERADLELGVRADLAASCVDESVKVPLNMWQRSALTDFVYNLGCGAFKSSTLLRLLNEGLYTKVPFQLRRFVYVNRTLVHGLERRREAECVLWEYGRMLDSTNGIVHA